MKRASLYSEIRVLIKLLNTKNSDGTNVRADCLIVFNLLMMLRLISAIRVLLKSRLAR